MTWFFIALGAPFLWALVNIVDKYLVTILYGITSTFAILAQLVEHVFRKDGVPSSILGGGS